MLTQENIVVLSGNEGMRSDYRVSTSDDDMSNVESTRVGVCNVNELYLNS